MKCEIINLLSEKKCMDNRGRAVAYMACYRSPPAPPERILAYHENPWNAHTLDE